MNRQRMFFNLVILPTAGFGEKGPSEAGIARIEMASASANGDAAIIIIGGKRDEGPSEAEVYAEYMKQHYPDRAEKIKIVDASATCSNRDLLAAMPKIDGLLEEEGLIRRSERLNVYIVSYSEYNDRMELCLDRLGFRHINRYRSGEEPAYSPLIELVLATVTCIDPFWQWLGLPLVWLANRRLKETYQR